MWHLLPREHENYNKGAYRLTEPHRRLEFPILVLLVGRIVGAESKSQQLEHLYQHDRTRLERQVQRTDDHKVEYGGITANKLSEDHYI